ncbi:MAG TPA: phosphoribosylformylglycinamidine synthase subunit PurQ [Spirochaetia bacterium]|nr:phosphoribosylformylglycinamidine synthase subunit PurQ [Spirochaetia bacterium]
MVAVPVGVVTGYGINADRELAEAFRRAGGAPELVHVQDLIDGARKVSAFRILAFPGGFSFGDHLGSGLVFAHLVRRRLRRELDLLLADGGLVLGVCNGFQALVKMGILPNLGGGWQPQVSLVHNASGLFEDSWVEVEFDADSPCVWTQGLAPMELPIRHGEGRFIAASQAIMSEIDRNHLAAVRYRGRNPNGSQGGVAGITDATGRVFGLMPHPEAFLYPENHPRWSRDQPTAARGLELFENGVRAAQ